VSNNLQNGNVLANHETFKGYLFFWSGQLVSLFGSSVANFVIIWWITLETGSALYLSLASLVGFAPVIILGPLTGVLVDRWNRKALILIVDLLQAVVTVALIFLFWSGAVAIWQILALLGLKGAFQAFHMPAVLAIIPTMVPKEKLSRMNGVNYVFTSGVNLAGPIIAAVLLSFLPISQILWIDVITFLIALAPLLAITIPSVVKKEEKQLPFRRQFAEGFGFIRRARGLLPFIMLATGINFSLSPLSTLLPYYVNVDHSGIASDLALVMVFFQGGALAGGILMSVLKISKNKVLLIVSSMYLLFSGYILVALTPTGLFWFMGLSGLVLSICFPIVDVLAMTLLQTVVPMKMQGRVTSVVISLAHAAQPIGMVLSGLAAILTRTANLFLGCAIVGMFMVTLSWFLTDMKYVERIEEIPIEQNK
jgi:DHA3 family macrolide efflux protein-like MFS transporter